MMRLPDSQAVTYTLAGASIVCAVLVTAVYVAGGQLYPSLQLQQLGGNTLNLDPGAISAKAAIVYNPATKSVLFDKNAEAPLLLASLTKLMTATAVLAEMDDSTRVTITAADLKPDGDWGFKPGEVWSLHDLLTFGLVVSSNDAMAAAANAAPGDIITTMNLEAARLGLTQTYFSNPTGLDVDLETAGAYGSAHDMALLAADFLAKHPALFEATTAHSISITSQGNTLTATSTDVPLLDIPGLIGAKTGYTDLAGGNLVAAVDIGIGHPFIIAVLGSTRDGRFKDVQTLVSAVRAAAIR